MAPSAFCPADSPVSHRVKGLVHVEQPVGQWQPVRGHISAHLQAESWGPI